MFICFHFSPWNGESCPNDVKDYVFAHFENPMIKSIASYTFSTTKRYLTSDYKLINCRAGLFSLFFRFCKDTFRIIEDDSLSDPTGSIRSVTMMQCHKELCHSG